MKDQINLLEDKAYVLNSHIILKILPLLILCLLYLSACNQTEPINLKGSDGASSDQVNIVQTTATQADTQRINAHIGISDELSSELKALVFYGKKGRVPKIYNLSLSPTDELKIYLFALTTTDAGSSSIETPYVWSLYPRTRQEIANGETGYTVEGLASDLRLSASFAIQESLLQEVRHSAGKSKRWFIGAILGGHSHRGISPQGLVYSFDNRIQSHPSSQEAKYLNTQPNHALYQRISIGNEANGELRYIPLATQIREVTAEQSQESVWMQETFKPRGILLNFALKNETEHTITINQLRVESEDMAFSGHYSLLPQHLLDETTGAVRDFPLMINDITTEQDLRQASGLKAQREAQTFDIYTRDARTISLAPGEQLQGDFTLWAVPLLGRSTAQASWAINYQRPFGSRSYHYTSQRESITIRPKRGESTIRESLSYSKSKPMTIIEDVPHNVDAVDTKRWLALLPDQTPISRLSLAGTHDTMADNTNASSAALALKGAWQTQDWSLKQQLEAGIRYIDIRLKYDDYDKKFFLYHGKVYLGYEFEKDVLNVLKDFLTTNPSEFVIMSLKKEGGDGQTFNEQLPKVLANYYLNTSKILRVAGWSATSKLQDLRGQVLILSREGYIGMGNWLSGTGDNKTQDAGLWRIENTVAIEERLHFADIYKGSTSWDKKKEQIRNGINYALRGDNESRLVLNHLNQAYYSSKWTPRTMARVYNQYAKEQIEAQINSSSGYPVRSGFMIMDFANEDNGQALIKQLIDQSLIVNNATYRLRRKQGNPAYN